MRLNEIVSSGTRRTRLLLGATFAVTAIGTAMLRAVAQKGASRLIVVLSGALLVVAIEVAIYIGHRSDIARHALEGRLAPSRASYALLTVAVPLWMMGQVIHASAPLEGGIVVGASIVLGVLVAALERSWGKLSRIALACILVGLAVSQFAHLRK